MPDKPAREDAAGAAFKKLSFLALARYNLFQLLASTFYDPTPDFVQQLINGSFLAELQGYFSDLISHHAVGMEALDPLRAYQAKLSSTDPASLLSELKVEYVRLFLGPGRPVVQPYETFYDEASAGSGKPLLIVSPAAMEVEKVYLEAGLVMITGRREPPDFFPIELEFLYYLCKKESDSWAAGDHIEAKKWRRRELMFIDGHLGKWGPQFCRKVENEARQPFYLAMAHFTRSLLLMKGSNLVENSEEGASNPLREGVR